MYTYLHIWAITLKAPSSGQNIFLHFADFSPPTIFPEKGKIYIFPFFRTGGPRIEK